MFALAVASSESSWAQEAPAPGVDQAGAASSQPAPSSASAAPAPTASAEVAPLEAASIRQLRTWGEALKQLNAYAGELTIAKTRVARASAGVDLSESAFFPKITADAQLYRHVILGTGTNITPDGLQTSVAVPDPATLYEARLQVWQPVFDPAGWRRHSAGAADETAEQAALQATVHESIATLALELLAQLELRESIRDAKAALATVEEIRGLTVARYNSGQTTQFDVLAAEREVGLQGSITRELELYLADAQSRLSQNMGSPDLWALAPEVSSESLLKGVFASCRPVSALSARADVAAAARRSDAARSKIAAESGRAWPVVALFTQGMYTNQPYTANSRPFQWTVGAQVSFTAFDGGETRARGALAAADASIEATRATQLTNAASREERLWQLRLSLAESQVVAAEKAVSAVNRALESAKVAFNAGIGTILDVVTSARDAHEAASAFTRAKFTVVRARLGVHLAKSTCAFDESAQIP